MISADLGKQLEQAVTQLVATGRYGSKSEVLREGVRLVQERESRLAALDASIARGLTDAPPPAKPNPPATYSTALKPNTEPLHPSHEHRSPYPTGRK